jgi:3-hydroxyacyl-CoA dehydrogenase/enoyl-CoA hydratase/3-hydroxybutyryl-CoA epimerase/enoyl-CoA isomerase
MIYEGQSITVEALENGVVEMKFDNKSDSVNKFDSATVMELRDATAAIAASDAKGVVVTSGKPVFIVGADITEFGTMFGGSEDDIMNNLAESNAIFNSFEDLDVPTVAAINGFALGGGFEMCMACDYRVMSTAAKVGLPETKLGIYPGFGGTVRLPRIIGVDNAAQWIAAGADQRANKALAVGAVDAAVAPELLKEAALDLLGQCMDGTLDYKAKRQEKLEPLKLNDIEAMMSFTTCKAMVGQQAGPNFPAPIAAITSMEKAYKMGRDDALKVEAKGFAKLVRTPQADSLIGLFLSDQLLGKKAKGWAKKSPSAVSQAAVLGAGIMGGGIAYQSAYKGTPIVMKDINQDGINLGLSEANKLLAKRVNRGRMSPAEMGETLNRINPTLSYADLANADMVVEAVVENPKVKKIVLAEVEDALPEGAVIASNTSTISITYLAEALKKPENFCGMHFFNPVHAMPLVEVIRGEKSSDETIAKTVAYALALGKKPVVVNDCPGFLVNRVLFPYFAGFSLMVIEGVDFTAIDKVMEKWGMPMGPAYLSDVVGIDTGVHAADVLAEGFPDRMARIENDPTQVMFDNNRYGQKNGVGFYSYETDKRGKPKKVASEETYALLKPHVGDAKELDAEEIIARMMVPMCTEMARCLEEGVVESAAEADMSLIYGTGFPVFRGGVFRWMDSMGMQAFCDMADKYSHLGKLYEPTATMREMAANGTKYYA